MDIEYTDILRCVIVEEKVVTEKDAEENDPNRDLILALDILNTLNIQENPNALATLDAPAIRASRK